MTAADRRWNAYELHRRFLLNVTGLVFGPAYMDPKARGVGFRAIGSLVTPTGLVPIEFVSIIREREDLFR